MNQFDYEGLMIVADSFQMNGDGKPEEVKAAYRRCARELREHLRNSRTDPAPPPDSDSECLP